MGNLLKISKQTFWQIFGKVITSISTFIILGLVARNYGESGTGVFTLALTYLSMFYLLADFGFNAHVLKNLQFTIYNLQFRKLLGTRIVWSLILVIIAIGLLLFWAFATPLFSQAILFGSLAIIGVGIFVTCNLIFQSKLRYDLSVLASSIGTLIGLGLTLYFVQTSSQVPYLLLGHFLGWSVIGVVALFLVRRFIQKITPIYSISYTLSLLKDSWPIAATLALNVVYFRADSFLIAYFRNSSEVGIYSVAYSVFQTALVFPAFIMNVYYPLMLKSLKQIKIVGLALFVIAALGTILTLVLAPFITAILTGGGFEGSSKSLQILSLGFPAFFLSSLLMWILVTRNKYKTMLAIYGVGLLVNIILNLNFIPQYSFIGASWITIISEYLILLLQIVSLIR